MTSKQCTEILLPAYISYIPLCRQVHALEWDDIPYSKVQMNSSVYPCFQHTHHDLIWQVLSARQTKIASNDGSLSAEVSA